MIKRSNDYYFNIQYFKDIEQPSYYRRETEESKNLKITIRQIIKFNDYLETRVINKETATNFIDEITFCLSKYKFLNSYKIVQKDLIDNLTKYYDLSLNLMINNNEKLIKNLSERIDLLEIVTNK